MNSKAIELVMVNAIEAIIRNSNGYKVTHSIYTNDDDPRDFFKSKKKTPERIIFKVELVKTDEEE